MALDVIKVSRLKSGSNHLYPSLEPLGEGEKKKKAQINLDIDWELNVMFSSEAGIWKTHFSALCFLTNPEAAKARRGALGTGSGDNTSSQEFCFVLLLF